MRLTTVDIIARRSLLELGLPIHYYCEFLFHLSSGIRELSFDTLNIVNTVNIAVNEYGAADLPDDYVDDVGVFMEYGLALRQIPHQSNINPLRVHNGTTGLFEPHATPEQIQQSNGVGFIGSSSYMWFWNVNEWGERTGRYFGTPGGTVSGYTIVKERRQIQFTGGFENTNAILQYISDGQSSDNATQITPKAIACLQAYANWKRSPNASIKDSAEARTFYNEKRLLRARENELLIIDIKNILRNSYMASPKN
jgi:hypothetical protein